MQLHFKMLLNLKIKLPSIFILCELKFDWKSKDNINSAKWTSATVFICLISVLSK